MNDKNHLFTRKYKYFLRSYAFSSIARFSFRSGPMSNHCIHRALTHRTKSKVRHFDDASWCCVFLVSDDAHHCRIHTSFAPFSAFPTVSEIFQASDPYVKMLHTHVLYNLMCKFCAGLRREASDFWNAQDDEWGVNTTWTLVVEGDMLMDSGSRILAAVAEVCGW